MAASDPRAKVIGLLNKIAELDEDYHGKRSALMAEVVAILGGGEGIGVKLGRLKAFYSQTWQERYKAPYAFNHAIDTSHLKRFLAGGFSEDEITGRIFAYIKSDDQFYVKARHPFLIFVKGFNSFVAPAKPIEDHAAAATSEKMRGLRGE